MRCEEISTPSNLCPFITVTEISPQFREKRGRIQCPPKHYERSGSVPLVTSEFLFRGTWTVLPGQWLTATYERKLRFSETYFIPLHYVWMMKLIRNIKPMPEGKASRTHYSATVCGDGKAQSEQGFNTRVRELGFPNTSYSSLTPRCVAHFIYKNTHYNTATQRPWR